MDNLKISDNDSKALQDFLTDIKCLEEIKSRAEKFNLLDVFGIAQNEIRHSFFSNGYLIPRRIIDWETLLFAHLSLLSSPQNRSVIKTIRLNF